MFNNKEYLAELLGFNETIEEYFDSIMIDKLFLVYNNMNSLFDRKVLEGSENFVFVDLLDAYTQSNDIELITHMILERIIRSTIPKIYKDYRKVSNKLCVLSNMIDEGLIDSLNHVLYKYPEIEKIFMKYCVEKLRRKLNKRLKK